VFISAFYRGLLLTLLRLQWSIFTPLLLKELIGQIVVHLRQSSKCSKAAAESYCRSLGKTAFFILQFLFCFLFFCFVFFFFVLFSFVLQAYTNLKVPEFMNKKKKKQKKKIEVHPFSFVNVVGFSLLFLWCNMCCLKIDRCSVIAIQVHDELVLEVDPSVIKEAALLLQMSMENAALLLGIFLLFVVHILYILRICSFCILSHYLFFSSFACQTESGKNVGFFGTFPSYCA